MTPGDVFADVCDRVAYLRGDAALFTAREVARWPAEAVAALKACEVLAKGPRAESAECPGCEERCTMPLLDAASAHAHVRCETTYCGQRFTIRQDEVAQWQVSPEAIGRFVAGATGARFTGKWLEPGALMQIGTAMGAKRAQMLCLAFGDDLGLVVGAERVSLEALVTLADGALSLDTARVQRAIDAATGDARATPGMTRNEERKPETQARHDRVRQDYLALRRRKPGMSQPWYAGQLAAMAPWKGLLKPETIRKILRSRK
jgi:hypothetical protein